MKKKSIDDNFPLAGAYRYQRAAARTLREQMPELSADHGALVIDVLQIANKCGALCEIIKKVVFHEQPLNMRTLDEALFRLEDSISEFKYTLTMPIESTGASVTSKDSGLMLGALGIAGESAEVNVLVRDAVNCAQPLDKDAVKKELGDVLWYVAALCTKLDLSLANVMQANLDKLQARYPGGFDAARSTVRDGKAG